MNDNLITQDYEGALKLIRSNVCGICKGILFLKWGETREEFTVNCIAHGVMTFDTVVSKYKADRLAGDVAAASVELKAEINKSKPSRSEAEILAELGF